MNSYKGVLVTQRQGCPIQFLVFVAKAREITRWARADNIRLDRGNVQRALVDARWRQITKFFNASPRNAIPTNVTIAFDEQIHRRKQLKALKSSTPGYVLESLNDGLTKITFPDSVVEYSFIIDGQHRLKGMSELDYDIFVPVSLFVSLPRLERAFQFVTINNKAHKVPTDNLKAPLANFDAIENDLRIRLANASIAASRFVTAVDLLNEDPDSPFHRMVDWVNNRFADANPVVQPSALENSLRAIVRAFPETKEDEADALVVLNAMWREIFGTWKINYKNASEFPNLMMKATIQTVSEMIIEKLKSDYDPAFASGPITANNGDAAAETAKNLITGIPKAFWKDEWMLKSLDTSAGREIIETDIRAVKRAINEAKGAEVAWKEVCRLYKSLDEE